MSSRITRLTVFKIPDPEHVAIAVKGYNEVLAAGQEKDGKPYIISMEAGPIDPEDARAKDYTFVSKMVFANKADMDYYENKCDAHKAFKSYLKDQGIVFEGGPPLTLIFTSEASFSI